MNLRPGIKYAKQGKTNTQGKQMAKISRRKALIGTAAVLAAGGAVGWLKLRKKPVPIGFDIDLEQLASARKFLNANPAIDMHAHPGRTFVKGATGLKGKMRLYAALGTFEDKTVADMQAGGVGAASFSTVADFSVLGLGDTGLTTVREFDSGEAHSNHKRQIANMKALEARGLVKFVENEAELNAANGAGETAAILSAEGGDFLEGSAERVAEAAADGLQYITIVHYRHNEVGDIMTASPVAGGLTDAGRTIIKAMNANHMLIDLAHASEATAFGALEASQAPVMCSHTHIAGPNVPDISRFISLDLAKAITEGGGVIGAWPAGLGISDLSGYIDRIMQLIDAVGIDHVGLGTDMDANYKPVMETYSKMPHLVVGLRGRGLSDADLNKFVRGNFLRVWRTA